MTTGEVYNKVRIIASKERSIVPYDRAQFARGTDLRRIENL